MNADLELYRVFCEVVKHKNISKTAESLYISQSAVTQAIQKLETLLGGKVFYRSKKGVELTEEGRNLYEYIKNSIETMSNAENIFSQYTNLEKGKIRIGGGNSLIKSLILTPMIEFTKKYPGIDITINSGMTDTLIQKLANGELDLLVLNLPYDVNKYSNIEITPLKESKYCFFCSKKYAKEHNIKELNNSEEYKYIFPKTYSSKSKILGEYLKENNIEINSNYEVSSSSIMKKMVMNDIGIGFAKLEAVEDVLDEIKIIKKISPKDAKEGIATLSKTMTNRATLELKKEIEEYYKQK